MSFIKALLTSLSFCLVVQGFSPSQKIFTRYQGNLKKEHSDTSLNLGIGEAWDAYNSALESDPLLVKSVTAGFILGCADFAGQFFEKSQGKSDDGIDFARAFRFAVFGLVLQAPWNHFYYLLLDSQIPPTPEPFTPTNGVKVFIDQFIQAPIFTVLIFVFLGALEGKSIEKIQDQLKTDYKDTIVANCKYIEL